MSHEKHPAEKTAEAAAPHALVPGASLFTSPLTRNHKTGALESAKPLTEDEVKKINSSTALTFVHTTKTAGVVIASGGELDGKTLRQFDSSREAVEWCEQFAIPCRIQAAP